MGDMGMMNEVIDQIIMDESFDAVIQRELKNVFASFDERLHISENLELFVPRSGRLYDITDLRNKLPIWLCPLTLDESSES
jgi:hypothetical protein